MPILEADPPAQTQTPEAPPLTAAAVPSEAQNLTRRANTASLAALVLFLAGFASLILAMTSVATTLGPSGRTTFAAAGVLLLALSNRVASEIPPIRVRRES